MNAQNVNVQKNIFAYFQNGLNPFFVNKTSGFNSIPGDLNNDDHVDINDYNLLIQNFGNPYTIFDYNVLIGNYGK